MSDQSPLDAAVTESREEAYAAFDRLYETDPQFRANVDAIVKPFEKMRD